MFSNIHYIIVETSSFWAWYNKLDIKMRESGGFTMPRIAYDNQFTQLNPHLS